MNTQKTILIIDNNRHLVRGFIRALKLAGYEVIRALTGDEGLCRTSERTPDVIVLNVELPDMSGIELCKRLKTDPELKGIYVVLFSETKITSIEHIEGLESGADGYIKPPISNREFLARIQAILRIKETETQLSDALEELQTAEEELRRQNTALLATQEQLRASQQKYANLYDFAPVGYCSFTKDGLIVEANLTAAEQLGVKKTRLLNTQFNDYIAEEHHPAFFSHLREIFRTGIRQACELKLQHDDCAQCYVHLDSILVKEHGELPAQCRTTITDIAERRQAEDALKKSERRFKAISSFAGVAIGMLDTTGNFLYVNPSFMQMMGYSREEMLKMSNIDITHPEDIAKSKAYLQTLIDGQKNSIRVEKRYVHKNGQTIWVDLSQTPILDDENKVYAFICAAVDITERKQAEEALQHLKKAVETMQVGVTITDLDRNIIYTNPAEARMHGYQPKNLVGKHVTILGPSERRRPMTWEQIRTWKQISKNKTLIRESTNIRKDGTLFPVRLMSDVVKNMTGEPIAIVTTCEDISDRKRAETEIEAGARRLQTVIETVGEGITLSDETGYFEIFNSKMEEITGYAKEEANGCHDFLRLLYPNPDDYYKATNGIQAMREQGGRHDTETTIHAKDGTRKTLLVSTSIIRDQGRLWFLSAYRDITERKHNEEELKQAKEAAEAANRAKSEFLANMSHELRTPLNGILGYAQILKHDTHITEKQCKGIGIIQRSGEHLLTLINDILDLSKIEAGKIELTPNIFQLPGMLKNLVEMTDLRARQKGVGFYYENEMTLPNTVYTDEKRLRQILLNLLGNAVKFTSQGSVTFRVKTTPYSPAEQAAERLPAYVADLTQLSGSPSIVTIHFEVEDTGIGIPADKLDSIFSPFEQVSHSFSQPEGTGLGLAISQRLVYIMGSELHVKSRVAQGSTFWFDIVLPAMTIAVVSHPIPPRHIIGMKGRPHTILIADDKEENRILLKDMLLPLGFTVIEAINGHDAIDKARQYQPELILLDLIMPKMDGFEATRQIRQIPALKNVTIIAVSASVFDQTREKSTASGCDDFLTKPLSERVLLNALQQHLNLEWIYCDDEETHCLPQEIDFSGEAIIPPASEEIARLYQLAIIGDIIGIRERIQELENENHQFAVFITKIRQFTNELNIVAIQQFLKQYMER